MSSRKRVRSADGGLSATQQPITRKLYVWGSNEYGQLGLGDERDGSMPQLLELPENA